LKNVGADLQPTNTVWQIWQNKYSFEQGKPLFSDPVIASPLISRVHATRARRKITGIKGAKEKGAEAPLV